jgi:hypothetical protein
MVYLENMYIYVKLTQPPEELRVCYIGDATAIQKLPCHCYNLHFVVSLHIFYNSVG